MAAVAGTKAGTGYVEIHPDFSRFQDRVGKQLNQALAPVLQKAGGNAGKDLARGIDRGGFGQMLRQRFGRIGDDAGKELAARVSKGAKRAEGDMFGLADAVRQVERNSRKASRLSKALGGDMFGIGKAAKEAGRGIAFSRTETDSWTRRADGATASSRRLRDRIKGLGYEFGSLSKGIRTSSGGFSGFDGVMARVNRSSQFFRNILRTIRWPAFVAGVGLALQGLSALAAGAVAAASALGSLSGLMVALPAAALAGAQALGAFKLATAGVTDTVKAAFAAEVKGGTQATDMLRQQRDATERVADAKRNLIDVQHQAEKAQDDLREARESATRQLQDMRLAAEASGTSERQAALSLREARRELARTLADPASSGLDVQGAELAVEQARNDLQGTRVEAKRARQDYRDAQKSGIDGMPEVVAAKEAEADANQAVTDAQRDLRQATEDATAAMENQGSAATALQQKMSQLPPAGQKFVRFLVSLKPRLDALRATAAKGFLPGAEKGLTGALRNFGVFRGLIDGTSKALGRLAAKAGQRLGSAMWGKDLSRLGKLNARIINRMGDAGLNLADALRHVMVAAEPFLDWLSGGVKNFSQWVKEEAAAGRETGRLSEFLDRTRETMERVWPILKGVGGALLNIGDAARPLGNEILDSLGRAAEGWRRWTDSTKGQNRLKAYFTETKPAIFEMGRLVRDVGKTFFELGKQRGVAHLLQLVRTELVPALKDLVGATTGFASGFLKQFGRLRKEGVPTFDAFVQVLAEHAGQVGWRIAKALTNAFLNAGVWGKLAITGFLLAKFGGLKAFGELGLRVGSRLGKSFFTSASKWIAGTEAGSSLLGWFQGTFGKGGRFGKAASVAGQRMGRIFGRGMALGAVAGLVLFAPTISDAIDKYIKEPFKNALEGVFGNDVADIVSGASKLIDPGNLGPVPTLLGVDAKGFVKDRINDVLEIPKPNTEKAEKGFEDFRRKVGQEGERTRKAFRSQLDLLPGVAERSGRGVLRQMLPRLDSLKEQGGKKGDAFAGRVGGSFKGLVRTATTALDTLGFNVREMLRTLGGPVPKFNLRKALQSLPELEPLPGEQRGGQIKPARFATGGLATVVPGSSTGDRHLLSLNGRPVAKVESKEGIFVGNRNLMGALHQANAEVPRFQKGGQLGPEPQIAGPAGALHSLGQMAIKKVYEGAKDFLDKHGRSGGYFSGGKGSVVRRMGRILFGRGLDLEATAGIAGNSYQESDWNPLAMEPGTDNGGLFGFTAGEKSMAALRAFAAKVKHPWSDVGTQVSFMLTSLSGSLKSRLNAASSIAETTALFMNEWERPNAALANLPRRIEGASMAMKMLQGLQGTRERSGLQAGGTISRAGRIIRDRFGGSLAALAGGGMVDPSWDPGSEVINSSIAQLVAEYAKRFDIDITAGYDPGGGHVSPGHNSSGTATDVIPRDGNWDGAFAEGLETLGSLGFEVGYDGSIPGTEDWPDHGRGNHAHIEWVGNGTAADARQRLREYLGGVGAGAEGGPVAAPKERIPATYRGAKTGSLDFGPKPKTVKEVDRQIARWQKEAPIYRKAKAYAESHGKPGTAQAIGRNLTKIEERLVALRSLRTQLRLKEVRKRLNKRIAKAFGRFGGYDQIIEGSQLAYEKASQDAEQIVGLEPLSPELVQQKGESDSAFQRRQEDAEKSYVERFTSYVSTRERPAFQAVLDRVADWRNNILRAERFGFGKGRPSVATSEGRWEGEVRGVRKRIEQIKQFSDAVQDRVEGFKRAHPKEDLPTWLKKQLGEREARRKELPALKLRDTRLSDAILKARGRFFPGGDNRLDELPMGKRVQTPLPGSGSLEEKLREVQGIHWPEQHELLSAGGIGGTRSAGRFGGFIWDLQETIEGLGLKISQAANGIASGGSPEDGGDSELATLLREIAEREHKGRLVSEKLAGTLSFFNATYGDLPKFHSGGVTPGPSTHEFPALLKGHETVRTAEQELGLISAIQGVAGRGGDLLVEVNVLGEVRSDYEDPVEVVLRDPKTKRVIQRTRGGRMTAGGARR
jgi:hypothetical protein